MRQRTRDYRERRRARLGAACRTRRGVRKLCPYQIERPCIRKRWAGLIMAPSQCVPWHFSSCKSPCHCRSNCRMCRSSCWGCVSTLCARICGLRERSFVRSSEVSAWIFIVTCFPVGSNANESQLIVLESAIADVFGVLMRRCFEDRRGTSRRRKHVTFARKQLPGKFLTVSVLIADWIGLESNANRQMRATHLAANWPNCLGNQSLSTRGAIDSNSYDAIDHLLLIWNEFNGTCRNRELKLRKRFLPRFSHFRSDSREVRYMASQIISYAWRLIHLKDSRSWNWSSAVGRYLIPILDEQDNGSC
jgi:hypothetical protein